MLDQRVAAADPSQIQIGIANECQTEVSAMVEQWEPGQLHVLLPPTEEVT